MDLSKTLDPVSRLVVGAVVEDAVDQLAIVSATFGPVAEQHVNTSRRKLEDILVKAAEEESNEEEGGEIKQLHCETAYIQKVVESIKGRRIYFRLLLMAAKVTMVIVKVLEQSISSLYKSGEGVPLEEALEAYRSRLQEKEAILVNEQQVSETSKETVNLGDFIGEAGYSKPDC